MFSMQAKWEGVPVDMAVSFPCRPHGNKTNIITYWHYYIAKFCVSKVNQLAKVKKVLETVEKLPEYESQHQL